MLFPSLLSNWTELLRQGQLRPNFSLIIDGWPKKFFEAFKAELEEGPRRKDGRGDKIRTCDLMLPKHARYQLRYTPIRLTDCRGHELYQTDVLGGK